VQRSDSPLSLYSSGGGVANACDATPHVEEYSPNKEEPGSLLTKRHMGLGRKSALLSTLARSLACYFRTLAPSSGRDFFIRIPLALCIYLSRPFYLDKHIAYLLGSSSRGNICSAYFMFHVKKIFRPLDFAALKSSARQFFKCRQYSFYRKCVITSH